MQHTGLGNLPTVDQNAVMRANILDAPLSAGKRQQRVKTGNFGIGKLDIRRGVSADQHLCGTERIDLTRTGKHIASCLLCPSAVTAAAFSARRDQNHERTDIHKYHDKSSCRFPKKRIPLKHQRKIHISHLLSGSPFHHPVHLHPRARRAPALLFFFSYDTAHRIQYRAADRPSHRMR